MVRRTAIAHGRARLWTIAVLAAALLTAVGVYAATIAATGTHPQAEASPAATSMNGKPVTLDPGSIPVSAARSHAVADTGYRLIVPSVGLDVPLGAMNDVDGQVTPPGFTSAYWIRNLGVPATDPAAGTVFVAMHSLRDGAVGPGNYLIDTTSQTPAVHVGARVSLAGVDYTVTGAEKILKTKVPYDRALWADQPDRLVLITCLQNPHNTESPYNIVITAAHTTSP